MINQYLLLIRLFLYGFVISSLTSCQVTSSQVFPELTSQHLKSLSLDVAKLEIIHSYNQPMTSPYVEHLFHTPPSVALNSWARDRLRSVGTKDFARFTIIEASVIETKLDKQKGIMGLFIKDQSERYDAVLEAKLEIFDDSGRREGFAKARAIRSITVREDSSINQRDRAWYSLTEELVRDINTVLEKNIYKYLSRWIN